MDIILIAGLWLRASAWQQVADELRKLGHRPISLALPGVDDGEVSAVLDDQVATVIKAVDAAQRPLVVGHSAAASLAWIAADQRPEDVSGVVLIGGFPSSPGDRYADFFEKIGGAMPFPGWEPFEGADSADLDESARHALATGAVPVPAGVATGLVQLRDERRFDVPVIMVCPEYSPEQARGWIAEGAVPELTKARRLTFIDIDSGHWPMITRPVELARVLDDIART